MKVISTHDIDGSFVESHAREVMEIIEPTDGQVIGRVTLADGEDTRRAIAAAKRASRPFSRRAPYWNNLVDRKNRKGKLL
jgi:aldehyde dehydrogenase (NAD+)